MSQAEQGCRRIAGSNGVTDRGQSGMHDKARHTAIASAELLRATGTTVALLRAFSTRLGDPTAGTEQFPAQVGRPPGTLAGVAVTAASADMAQPFSAAATAAGASSYVGEVDALRGIAMSAVIAIHCGLLPFGWMGVWLFFVISGSVITSILAGSAAASPGWKMCGVSMFAAHCAYGRCILDLSLRMLACWCGWGKSSHSKNCPTY